MSGWGCRGEVKDLTAYAAAVCMAVLGVVFCATGVAEADEWVLPEPTISTFSRDGAFRFVVTPRALKSQLDYYNDAVNGIEPRGQLEGGNRVCTGRLERKTNSGEYELVWERPLVNDVAPVEVLVANTGNYVVTFDDWVSAGQGPNVVVIYDRVGTLVRRLALSDFLSPAEIDRLPRSLSSTFWGDGHYLSGDETVLVLRVVTEKTQRYRDPKAKFAEKRIDLQTGKVILSKGRASFTDPRP